MDLVSLATIKSLCRRYRIHPQKQRGQNFLINRGVLEKIVEAADLKKDDVILEIGPGFGVLTRELAEMAKRVVAVEKDARLVRALCEILVNYRNVEIVEEDILRIKNQELRIKDNGYKIVANLPYQITSAVFRKFLENEPRPSEIIVMVQKEVAERICASAGEMSLLSVSVQFFGKPEIVEIVPRAAFHPEPEVDSAILKISRIKSESEANLKRIDLQKFFRVVKIGFSARRKQLHNNLAGGLRLPNAEAQKILINLGFDPKIRAQDLSVKNWIKLVNQLNS